MARLFLTPIDLGKLELQNPRLQQLASDPGSPVEGQFYYNTTDDTLRFYTAAGWLSLGRLDQISDPTAAVDLNSQQITGLADPSDAQHAATQNYVLGRSLSEFNAPTGALDMGTNRITGVVDPTGAQDAATKNYVDGLTQGLSWKDSVRVATTANGTLASAFENGDTIDGVVLATGDRILIKDQTTGSQNGIYTVNASGAPTRADDASTGDEILMTAVFVEEGSTNADTAWVLQTNAPITIDTTSLTFAQFGAGTSYSEGTGIDITGNVISLDVPVVVSSGGTGATSLTDHGVLFGSGTGAITASAVGTTGTVLKGNTGSDPTFGAVDLTADVTGDLPVAEGGTGVSSLTNHGVLLGSGTSAVTVTAVGSTGTVLKGNTGSDPTFGAVDLTADVTGDLPVADGGTGASTAAGAKTNLGFMTRHAESIGDGAATSYNVDHNLGTLDVTVQVYRNSDGVEVECDVTRSTTNRVVVAFATAPTSNQYRAVVIG